MTPAEIAVAANRADKANRIAARFVELLEKNGAETHGAKMLDAFDAMLASDGAQLRLWTGAKCRHAPSAECWTQAREILRDRLPEMYALTPQDRDILAELERGREHATDDQVHDDAWDRHVDDEIAEGRGM